MAKTLILLDSSKTKMVFYSAVRMTDLGGEKGNSMFFWTLQLPQQQVRSWEKNNINSAKVS